MTEINLEQIFIFTFICRRRFFMPTLTCITSFSAIPVNGSLPQPTWRFELYVLTSCAKRCEKNLSRCMFCCDNTRKRVLTKFYQAKKPKLRFWRMWQSIALEQWTIIKNFWSNGHGEYFPTSFYLQYDSTIQAVNGMHYVIRIDQYQLWSSMMTSWAFVNSNFDKIQNSYRSQQHYLYCVGFKDVRPNTISDTVPPVPASTSWLKALIAVVVWFIRWVNRFAKPSVMLSGILENVNFTYRSCLQSHYFHDFQHPGEHKADRIKRKMVNKLSAPQSLLTFSSLS